MPAKIEDASFTIIRVATNGATQDGTPAKNRYTVDVEVSWGVFPAVMPQKTGRIKLSYPLKNHPAAKTITQAVAETVKRLEADGKIGGISRAILEIAPPSPGAAERTARTTVALRELITRNAAEEA
jgi:hypothetical protein